MLQRKGHSDAPYFRKTKISTAMFGLAKVGSVHPFHVRTSPILHAHIEIIISMVMADGIVYHRYNGNL